ncbi:reverse transcriptase domain-containing protein [Tanacetum coccineum]
MGTLKMCKPKAIPKSGDDTKIPQLVVPLRKVGDEAVHKELGDRMERAATTASSSEAEQDSMVPGAKIPYWGDVDAQTRFETTSEQSNDPPLSKVNTFGSGEGSMKILELMEIVKMVNGVRQLQALIDKKKVIITEASIRNDLHLDDAEGGRTGGRTGRGGGRNRGRSSDLGNDRIDGQGGPVGGQGTEVNDSADGVPDFSTIIAQQLQNLLPTILAQVGDQGSNQEDDRNQNKNVINGNIQGNVRNVIEDNDRRGCTYKEFLACNLKEYDGKGGAIVYTCWIEKMESIQDMSGCRDNQKTLTREEFFLSNEMQKLEIELWNHTMVGAGHVAYTDRFHELARLVPHLVTPENKRIERYVYGLASQIRGMVAVTEPTTIQKAMKIAGTLTDESIRNGSIKKNLEKRGNEGEPSKDWNGRDDNKRTRIRNDFATTTNPVRRENMGMTPKVVPRNVNLVNARNLAAARGACFECGGTDHYKSACPRLNRALGPGVNRPNQALAIDRGQGCGNNDNQAKGRAFMLGAEEARQDLNIMMGTFTLNNHYATTLFDSGADYSFVSTTFIPLLGIEPSDLGFSYEIEIASGQLVEIDKVSKGCKLEIKGHVFDINLIPFRSGSFDVIIGMDWLSNHKAKIICHEKVVRIPLLDGKVLG